MERKRNITQKDIAEIANVNRATVSVILNNATQQKQGTRVSEATRKRVIAIANELGYHVDDIARSIKTGKDKVIGYVSPDLTNDYIIPFVTAEMAKTAYTLSFFDINENLVDNCFKRKISAIIFHHSYKRMASDIKKLKDAGIKIAMAGATIAVPDCIHVNTDNHCGVNLGMNHLYKLGHRKIVFVGSCQTRAGSERYAAYEHFMQSKKLQAQILNITNRNFECSVKNFKDIFNTIHPTAFFCFTSAVAISLVYLLAENKLQIPEDVSVVGFGQNITKNYLTHIDEQYEKMSQTLIPALINNIENKNQEVFDEKLRPELVIGRSTGKPGNYLL